MNTGIFLAAGTSTRFGSQKLIYELDGIPLICRGLGSCIKSNLNMIIVVTGADRRPIENVIHSCFPSEKKIKVIYNEQYQNGMLSSFNKGLGIIEENCRSVMMILGDMPFVSVEIINKILENEKEGFFVIPKIGNILSHPRIIPSVSFQDFKNIPANGNGLGVIQKYKDKVVEVIFNDEKNFQDIDSQSISAETWSFK